MKSIRTASGRKITMSKREWEGIGKRAGWVKKASESEPKTYITKTEEGFSLIHQGSPLTASNRSLKDAFDVAKKYNLTVEHIYENGEFIQISGNNTQREPHVVPEGLNRSVIPEGWAGERKRAIDRHQ